MRIREQLLLCGMSKKTMLFSREAAAAEDVDLVMMGFLVDFGGPVSSPSILSSPSR